MDEQKEEIKSKSTKEKIVEWLENKIPKELRCCDMCGGYEFLIGDYFITPLIIAHGNMQTGQALPHFFIICKNCGNTKFFNGVVTGIYEDTNPEEKKLLG